MLMLKRRAGQKLYIGDTVVTFESIDGQWLRLSINAPPEVKIVRGEKANKSDDDNRISDAAGDA